MTYQTIELRMRAAAWCHKIASVLDRHEIIVCSGQPALPVIASPIENSHWFSDECTVLLKHLS